MSKEKGSSNQAVSLATEAMQDIAREGELLEEMAQEGGERKEAAHRRHRILLALLLPVLVILTAVNLLGYGPFRVAVEEPPSAELPQQMRAAVSYAIDEVEAFREEFGRLPETLEEVGSPDEGVWTYEMLGPDHYRITLIDGDESVLYDSIDDPDVFFADVREIR